MDLGEFTQGRTRETSIRRDQRGNWFNGSDAITHPNLVRNFNAWIDRAEDGRFCLSNAINWAYVTIDGPPFWVRNVEVIDAQHIRLTLSGETEELIGVEKIFVDPDNTLWCAVKSGRCPARFENHAALQLAHFLVDDKQGPRLRIAESEYSLAQIENPMSIGAAK